MRQLLWGFLALGSAAFAVACGAEDGGSSDPASNTTGGTGGSVPGIGGTVSGTGGSVSGTGGGTGGSVSNTGGGGPLDLPEGPLTKRAACRAYVQAQCVRRSECRKDPVAGECTYALSQCPDLLFSEGSLRTPEQVVACAEEWLTFDCALALVGKVPSCTIPGSLELGASCIHPSQCASAACSGSTSQCGECIPVVASGAACDESNACPDGEECYSGLCELRVPEYWTPPTQGAADGQPCGPDTPCQDGFVCAANAALTGTVCRPDLPDGADCYDYLPVEAGYRTCSNSGNTYCGADFLCHTVPARGQPCAPVAEEYWLCAEGLYCALETTTCEPAPGRGEPCGNVRRADGSNSGTTCADSRCDAGICKEVREDGESCSEANVVCAGGTVCTDGICRATDELTVYGDLCPL